MKEENRQDNEIEETKYGWEGFWGKKGLKATGKVRKGPKLNIKNIKLKDEDDFHHFRSLKKNGPNSILKQKYH
jgi:hypothetical protein